MDLEKLMAFMGKLVGDLGAMASVGPMLIGEKLGLYKALASGGPMSPDELAAATKTNEDMCANGCARRRPRSLWNMMLRRKSFQ